MGHKVNPKIHRMQVIYSWDSKWFSKKDYAKFAQQDVQIRRYIKQKFKDAHIDAICVERGPKNMTVTILAAKPGFIIGRGGQGLETLRKDLERKFLQMSLKVKLNIKEVKNPSLSAAVIAQTVSSDIEKRIPFRRVMKQAIDRVMKAGAQGVKVCMSGCLNGVEISRSETLSAGKIPLITLRSDVDYGYVWAHTIYGKIGIKVWIYKGIVFGRKDPFTEDVVDTSKKKSFEHSNRGPKRKPETKES
ncbi:MAG: 30S ribosomal protein S3 [Candidatus Magasanikbacteria bacterium CG11_big_fil_rev_8_21_14_0_20_39_34]|uniref:Small ribosomal subunit protein uS3 n=1 Tax=Candidatus Magasanikbacteria bacterium CG11_big_fil_rev_8_21_14_0_20_39_34 TaxID=1974653 RepID=A0A2H0N3S8_9BACT|nr:MAG: 30S ribosomal protein S3 [Candidatus Magasanikbacteria bacterium CG11_big_fil_rev_8_21_14_0_20_39_34]